MVLIDIMIQRTRSHAPAEEQRHVSSEQVNIIKSGGRRESNLELFRIVSMLIIVAHHYVVNSPLIGLVTDHTPYVLRDYMLLLFGCGGKIGVNCFVLITGYYMCRSSITLRKWLRLLGEVEFYSIVIYILFVLTGYNAPSIIGAWKAVFPFTDIGSNFTGCFLLFYGFIPFLNRLLEVLTEREHRALIGLCLLIYSVLPTLYVTTITFNYITWFCIVYILAAYLRMYPRDWFNDARIWGGLTAVSVVLSLASVAVLATIGSRFGIEGLVRGYNMVADSNKVLAIATAVSAFMLFKNLQIPYNSVINFIAASSFGVLLIHNNGTMSQWLWNDLFGNAEAYEKWFLPLHAVASVLFVYATCTGLDIVRRAVFGRLLRTSN